MSYQTLLLSIDSHIAHVRFNNPSKSNAMSSAFWVEIKQVFEYLDSLPEVRAIIVSGEGKNFSAGIDLAMLMATQQAVQAMTCEARKREYLYHWIRQLQAAFTAVEQCRKPIIAAVHGACIGAGVDFIACCDIRYCSADAYFSVKEVDLAIVADIGTLQRLRYIVSEAVVRELAFTARQVQATEAKSLGLVSQNWEDKTQLLEEAQKTATSIAQKSPLAMRGTKHLLNYSRNHTIEEGLHYVATWNAAMLFSKDITEAITATMQKRMPNFEN